MIVDDDLGSIQIEAYRPPMGLLAIAGAFSLVGLLGLILSPPATWSFIGYIASALCATCTIGLFRFLDAKFRTHPGYQVVPWSLRACEVLLVIAWIFAVTDAWRLATQLST